tara:strand:- start:7715 stop:7894 length:180 start_codon:yes stop_codon:yes gene_type:complete
MVIDFILFGLFILLGLIWKAIYDPLYAKAQARMDGEHYHINDADVGDNLFQSLTVFEHD